MSLTSAKPQFRTILDGLGYTEHKDAFNIDNVPNNTIDKTYHLTLGPVSGVKINQTLLDVSSTMTVVLFFEGYWSIGDSLDSAIASGQDALKEILKPANRLTDDLKAIQFKSMNGGPLSDTNDNVIRVDIEFELIIMICV